MQNFKMKLLTTVLIASGFTMPAFANDQDEYFDNARVTSVTPQTERVNNPRQECRTEYVRENASYDNDYRGERSNTGAIIGGVSGGLLGSQIGRGKGRVVAAAVGAGLGAIVGDRVGNSQRYSNNSRSYDRPIERCTSVDNWQTINRGYLVNYRYNGRNYTTTTANDPGNTIRVRVVVDDDNEHVSYYNQSNNYIQRSKYERDDDDDWHDNRHHNKHGHDNDRHFW